MSPDHELIERLRTYAPENAPTIAFGEQTTRRMNYDLRKAAARLAALNAELSERIEEGERLREALYALHHAVRDLGERDAVSGLTFFEESPTKNGECHWRWVQLANAQGKARAALPTPSRGGR